MFTHLGGRLAHGQCDNNEWRERETFKIVIDTVDRLFRPRRRRVSLGRFRVFFIFDFHSRYINNRISAFTRGTPVARDFDEDGNVRGLPRRKYIISANLLDLCKNHIARKSILFRF